MNPFLPKFKPYIKDAKYTTLEQITTHEGEIYNHILTKRIKYDGENHVKIYLDAAPIITKLSSVATKMFLILTYSYTDKNKDIIYCNFKNQVSKSTYYKGINELIAKRIIAKHENLPYHYYVNPNYFYNGNRI